VADEDEAAAPGRSLLLTAPEDVGLEAEGGPEGNERRVGHGELLVRGRHERQPFVLGEERLAGLEVDRDRGGASP
jgi:hypothetical protein